MNIIKRFWDWAHTPTGDGIIATALFAAWIVITSFTIWAIA
jgi:hypothetical protein